MVASPVEVMNLALLRINADPIQEVSDDSDEAIAANGVYEQAVRDALSRHAWSFAKRSRSLVKVSYDTPDPWVYAWSIPAEAFVVRFIKDSAGAHVEYELQDTVALTVTAGPLTLHYNVRAPEARWSAPFVEALSLKLAGKLMASLRDEPGEARNLESLAEAKFITAMAIDKRSATPPRSSDSRFIRSFRGGGRRGLR